jgi:hypothetical protein
MYDVSARYDYDNRPSGTTTANRSESRTVQGKSRSGRRRENGVAVLLNQRNDISMTCMSIQVAPQTNAPQSTMTLLYPSPSSASPDHTEPELSAHEKGLLMAPVAYEFFILTAAAHVPVTMMNRPETMRKMFRATRAR